MPGVLLVDDDESVRESTRYVLEEEGYDVLEAPDGQVAIEMLQGAVAPLVVLLDSVMPGLSGIEVVRLARGVSYLSRHVYIVWTASPARLPAELLEAPDVSILAKPFDIDTLLATVAEAAARLDGEASA
jgi:CheY-like chemotaxis protein